MIDLRSDTVTKPTPEMRRTMADAEVGDDVYGEDPTVNRLQEIAAEMFGKEAALFVPTGSMGNQIAVKLHTQPGQEVIIEERGHIYNYELGTSSVVAGVMFRTVKSVDGSGHLTWAEIAVALRLNEPYYSSPTGLICLENTHNFAGGSVMNADHCRELCTESHKLGVPVHMDGARIFNAAAALNTSVAELTREVDSVQFCLSKGLGAPIGSMLVGSRDFIAESRIWRKRFGGGMRQAGVIAAAGIVALQNSPQRLNEDHQNARKLAEGLATISGIDVDVEKVVTNIVIFDISATGKTSAQICDELKQRGILAIGFGPKIRMVTHCDVTAADIADVIDAFNDVIFS